VNEELRDGATYCEPLDRSARIRFVNLCCAQLRRREEWLMAARYLKFIALALAVVAACFFFL